MGAARCVRRRVSLRAEVILGWVQHDRLGGDVRTGGREGLRRSEGLRRGVGLSRRGVDVAL